MDKLVEDMLKKIADLHEIPQGAYNIRQDGEGAGRRSTENILIETRTDGKSGINIIVKPNTKNESVHIPVVLTKTGLSETVYNHFEIGEGADVLIVAGCGINNCGNQDSRHDGVHSFHICKNAKVKYVEKHYGEGDGTGERILNPQTIVNMEEGSECEMEMIQIRGVDSTVRTTSVYMGKASKLTVTERLMTHGSQSAKTVMDVYLQGEDSSAQIVSRTVAKDQSVQVFHPRAVGENLCKAHIQCDSIIMDDAKVSSIPEIVANHSQAQIIHEAAIGRINSDQLIKLCSFGLTETEAEEVIIRGFLK